MLITSESVKVGHPDIVCDSIAANIIATILDEEHKIEIFLGKGLCIVGGEVATSPRGMIKKINLIWEKADMVEALKHAASV